MNSKTFATVLAIIMIAFIALTTLSFAQQVPKGGCGGKGEPKCLEEGALNRAARLIFERKLTGCPELAASKEADEIRRLLDQPIDGTWNARIDRADAFASKCKK